MNGSCLCGEVKFKIHLEKLKLYQCHCSLCRKQSGTASSTGTVIESKNLEWISGMTKIDKWESSTGFTSHFCSQCGSPVPNEFRNTSYSWVPAGLIESGDIEVVANIFVCDSVRWSNVSAKINPFETKPEVVELIKLLN